MLATKEQKELIAKLASRRFGDIYSKGFAEFSEWLFVNAECLGLDEMDMETADRVIKKLSESKRGQAERGQAAEIKPKTDINTPFWEAIMRVAAKIYLKGFYEGQLCKNETPPALDVIVANIKKELGQ